MKAAFEAAMLKHRQVAILRGIPDDDVSDLTEALIEAGVRLIEVSLSDPAALRQLSVMGERAGDGVLIGAGTVTSLELANAAKNEGASFLVTPHTTPEVIEFANSKDPGVLCGVMTPTEVMTVLAAGARFLKLFPARVLGSGYVKQALGPCPDPELFVVGGTSSSNVGLFLRAGALGAGVGGTLSSPPRADERYDSAWHEARSPLTVVADFRR